MEMQMQAASRQGSAGMWWGSGAPPTVARTRVVGHLGQETTCPALGPGSGLAEANGCEAFEAHTCALGAEPQLRAGRRSVRYAPCPWEAHGAVGCADRSRSRHNTERHMTVVRMERGGTQRDLTPEGEICGGCLVCGGDTLQGKTVERHASSRKPRTFRN